jgi:hypothetical protein
MIRNLFFSVNYKPSQCSLATKLIHQRTRRCIDTQITAKIKTLAENSINGCGSGFCRHQLLNRTPVRREMAIDCWRCAAD